jgi:hypothetical protein
VALAAGSLLLVLLSGVFGQVRGLFVEGKAIAKRTTQNTAGMARLQQLVVEALPSDAQTNDISFEGTSQSLIILTVPPQALAEMGVVNAEVTVVPHPNGGSDIALTLLSSDPANTAVTRISVARLVSSNFRYRFTYGVRNAAGSVEETSRVAATGQLPAFIRLAETAPDGHIMRQHLLVPQNTTDARCRFDPVSMACRI